MFEKHKAQRAELARQSAAIEWQNTDALLGWCIDRAREVVDGSFLSASTSTPLRGGETALLEVDGVSLVEPRRGAGHWQGRSQGVSIRVPGTRSMRYRVGATKGTYVQGAEQPTVIDTGSLTITTKRAVFVGPKQTREWMWSKLTGIHDEPGVAWTAIAVSNRQKVSGVAYTPARATEIRFYLELGSAAGNGTANDLLGELEHERADHQQSRPEVAPPGPAT